MDRRRWTENRAGLSAALLTVVCAAGFAGVYVLTVRTTPGRQFGDASLRGALFTRAGASVAVDEILNVVSVAMLLAGMAAVALIALARLRRVSGLLAVGLLAVSNASTWLLKNYLLSRPDLGLSEVTPATLNSLPSGHTTAVFSVVVALMIVLPRRARHTAAIAGGSYATVTAVATMSAGWHRAGDSIAAFLMVGAWTGVAATAMVLIPRGATAEPVPAVSTDRAGHTRTFRLVSIGAAVVGMLLVIAVILVEPLRTSQIGAATAFLAGTLLISAVASAVLMAVVAVLDRTDP